MHRTSKWFCRNTFIFSVLLTGQLLSFSLPWGPYVISRAGRGSPSEHWYDHCCPIGLKSEISSDGINPLHEYKYCLEECCDHLEEITYTRPDGTKYTYCKHKDPKLNQVLKEEIKHLSHDELNKLATLFKTKDKHI